MPMTPEEKERAERIDRQLEFLAAHQAQLSSDLAILQQITAEHTRQIEKQGEQIAKHDEQIVNQGSQMQSLADTVLRLARILDERDRQTDAKINALINAVERYFSDGRH